MASQLELHSRAALCRQLAKREPANRVLWMAEAEAWARLSNRNFRGDPAEKPVTASWRDCERVRQDFSANLGVGSDRRHGAASALCALIRPCTGDAFRHAVREIRGFRLDTERHRRDRAPGMCAAGADRQGSHGRPVEGGSDGRGGPRSRHPAGSANPDQAPGTGRRRARGRTAGFSSRAATSISARSACSTM